MADLVDLAFFVTIVVLVIVVLILLLRSRPATQVDPSAMTPVMTDAITRSSGIFRGAITESLRELKVGEDIGAIKTSAASIVTVAQSLQTLFVSKGQRARWAEMQLVETLRDAFPEGKVKVQQNVPGIGTPDAHLALADGILCIDAKFPLESYRYFAEATDTKTRKKFAGQFRIDMTKHVDKIRADYVRPEAGTLPVAYAYLPSEAVYAYLVENEQDLLRDAAAKGVVVCSPSTLLASMNLIWTAERAIQIAERAEEIEKNLRRLSGAFEDFGTEWDTLRKHVQNAHAKMQETHTKYEGLKDRFERTARLETLDDAGEDKGA